MFLVYILPSSNWFSRMRVVTNVTEDVDLYLMKLVYRFLVTMASLYGIGLMKKGSVASVTVNWKQRSLGKPFTEVRHIQLYQHKKNSTVVCFGALWDTLLPLPLKPLPSPPHKKKFFFSIFSKFLPIIKNKMRVNTYALYQ